MENTNIDNFKLVVVTLLKHLTQLCLFHLFHKGNYACTEGSWKAPVTKVHFPACTLPLTHHTALTQLTRNTATSITYVNCQRTLALSMCKLP